MKKKKRKKNNAFNSEIFKRRRKLRTGVEQFTVKPNNKTTELIIG